MDNSLLEDIIVNQEDDLLAMGTVEEEDCIPLSPIVEMDESSDEQSEDLAQLKDDPNRRSSLIYAKLILETTVENFEDRPSQPETPPEILRTRLNSLQSDYEELKEFTELEKQCYHADCIPRDEVKSLKEEFTLLKEKVQYLMQENSDYQRKLEVKEDEQKNLISEIAITKNFQSEGMTLIRNMKQKLETSIKGDSTVPQEIEPSTPNPFLEIRGNDCKGSHVQGEQFLNSLKDLDELLEIASKEKKVLQDEVEHLQLKGSELNLLVEKNDQEMVVYQQSLTLAKSDTLNIQEKLTNFDKELREISNALCVSEKKRLEAEDTRDIVNDELFKLQNEIDSTQQKVITVLSTLENFVEILYNNPDIKQSLVIHADIEALEETLKNNYDLFGVSETLTFLEEIFLNLLNEVKIKDSECYELKINIDQLNNHLMKYEKDVREQKIELRYLSQEVNEHIPCRLLELENGLDKKDSEILRLQEELKSAYAKVDEFTNKLSESSIRADQIEFLLLKKSIEKINWENEILKLKDSITLALKSLEHIIESWDEKSRLEDLVNAFQEKETFPNLTNLLMNNHTQSLFSEVAVKCKTKLLLHDEETNNLCSKLKTTTSAIDRLESENNKVRLEVNTLDQIVRQYISNRVDDLEKYIRCSEQRRQESENTHNTYRKDKVDAEQNVQEEDLDPVKTTYGKLQKQINNFNKSTKPDDGLETIVFVLNEVENLLDSWDCTEKSDVSEFTQLLFEKLLKCCDRYRNSKVEKDLLQTVNKLEVKLLKLFEMKSQLLQTENSFIKYVVGDHENKEDLFKCTLENFQWTNDILSPKLKEESLNDNYGKEKECVRENEIKAIKKKMSLEITSLDETENEESLLCESVESIFSKLMDIIMKKEQEMTTSIENQQKEKVHNLKQTIEKLNNKLKSLESWNLQLESENNSINNELVALKNVNNSFELKLKSLTNDIYNKNLEIDNIKKKVFELMKENNSLVSELGSEKDLSNNYRHSVNRLENDIEKLNEDIANKSNFIEHLQTKLTSALHTAEHSDSKLNSTSLYHSARGDFVTDVLNETLDNNKFPIVINKGCLKIGEDQCEQISDFETGFMEMLRKEVAFINDMLIKESGNIALGEILSSCYDNLNILKEVFQNIGSRILKIEMSNFEFLQSAQTALEYKTKELNDFKLSLSKLYRDLVPNSVQMINGESIDEKCPQISSSSLRNEVDQIKLECFSFSSRLEDFEESAKMGHNIVQNLRENILTLINEKENLTRHIHELHKAIGLEQEKNDQQNKRVDSITKENVALIGKNLFLENYIRDLKLELSHSKRDVFTLKQHAETQQNVCYGVTEELRFFGYHCELMLSYIQSLEFKLNFTAQQKELLVKENTLLKGQVTSQNLEMNRFFNQIISRSPFPIKTQNQVLEVISHIFSEYKLLIDNNAKFVKENKLKQEQILQLQKELSSSAKQNSSLKFELTNCEDSIRNLRSELRNMRSKCQRRESICFDLPQAKPNTIDATSQTEEACCMKLKKQIIEQREKMDSLAAKLTQYEQRHRSSATSNPYNKQVSYLEGALAQAKEKIGRLHFALKQQEGHNQELVEALKRHQSSGLETDVN